MAFNRFPCLTLSVRLRTKAENNPAVNLKVTARWLSGRLNGLLFLPNIIPSGPLTG